MELSGCTYYGERWESYLITIPEFGGEQIPGRIHTSPDRKTLTMFYDDFLPASARVRVTFIGDNIFDINGDAVDADGDGNPGGTATIDFDTLSLTVLPGTSVGGRVFASELGDGGTNVPLAGVTITVDGMENKLRTVTDALGNFRLDPAPAGRFFVHIDGTTATNDIPEKAYYPSVGKSWDSIPGEETDIGNVFLPLVIPDTLQPVSVVEETAITFPDVTLAEYPELQGTTVMVPADSLYSDDGTRGGRVGIAPVAPDRLPGELPDGLDFSIVITVQTDGATNFDQPAPICFPNLDNLSSGAESALWSFNHDIGRFEVVGPMTVSDDGTKVCSDPGVGILAPGWHGQTPGSTGRGGNLGAGGSPEDGQESPNGQPGDPTDPIYLFSGEFHKSVEDLRIQGRGMDFVWARKYRSQMGKDTTMGKGWDFSYNIFIESVDADLMVHNGDTRSDRYRLQPNGSWSREEFFRELVKNGDDSYTLVFEDTGRWNFSPLDDSPAAGKLTSIVDRNSNQLTFAYDNQGRLATVTDTLDRDIAIAYNPDSLISTVTDFAGRVVRYEYYDGVEPGGNLGDLKSATSPAVVGTPNGNDFPDGKTVTYTYSTGFADERLNHNLLTATDRRRNDSNDPTFGDGPYLTNIYATTTNPNDLNFDRVIRQIWGNSDDIIDINYVPMLPSNANGNAVMRTIINDRNGNVKEYFWEADNRMVRSRDYTGRADPNQPTSALGNRPTGKLRSDDPDFFETLYEWNSDSLQRRVIHPNGNITEYVYESDLDSTAPPRTRRNLRILRRLPGTHTPVGDQNVIEELYEYDPKFNFISKHTDGRGSPMFYTYDDEGNLIHIQHRIPAIVEDFEYNEFGQKTVHILPDNGSNHHRRDEKTYYSSGSMRGYLHQEIVDAPNFALTTTYEYDLVGNMIRMIDPRGHDTQYIVNELDQVVRKVSREVTDGSGIHYEEDIFYDANNNVIRIDTQNIDDQGALQANTHFTTTYEFEILNHLIRKTEEVNPDHSIVTEYEYDANRNLVLTRYGEATNGNQPSNVTRNVYDERDLLFQTLIAAGDAAQSTTQFDYDANGNRTALRQGIEDTPRIVVQTFDGYDRLATEVGPMGNAIEYHYDANDNLVSKRTEGELEDIEGNSNNVRLKEMTYAYDAIDRAIRSETSFFNAETQMPIDDGKSVILTAYSDNSQITRVVNDNGHQATTTYDTANRQHTITDHKGNTVTFAYDANSNIISNTLVEKSDLGAADEVFTTTYTFDNLDRLIRTVDNVGNTVDYSHDSRDNQTLIVDALRPTPDALGNLIRYEGYPRKAGHFISSIT